MIIYNVTIAVEPESETELLNWLKQTHIPEVMETGLFLEGNLFRIMEDPDTRSHNSYAVQYRMESWGKYSEYKDQHSEELQKKTKDKFGSKVLSFRTFLEQM